MWVVAFTFGQGCFWAFFVVMVVVTVGIVMIGVPIWILTSIVKAWSAKGQAAVKVIEVGGPAAVATGKELITTTAKALERAAPHLENAAAHAHQTIVDLIPVGREVVNAIGRAARWVIQWVRGKLFKVSNDPR